MSTSNRSISSLEAEVATLTKLRNERLAQLLTAKSRTTLSSPNARQTSDSDASAHLPADSSDDDINAILLSQTAALAAENERWNVESLYRMTGITTFAVREPGPDPRELMGIRIEIFVDGHFKTPHYLILAPHTIFANSKTVSGTTTSERTDSKTHVTIYRHTLPAYFLPQLEKLKIQYLPPAPHAQSLDHLVTTVRKTLLLHEWRSFYLNRAKTNLMTATTKAAQNHKSSGDGSQSSAMIGASSAVVVSQFDIDPECLFVQIRWINKAEGDDAHDDDDEDGQAKNQRHAALTLTEDGLVDKVMVKMGDKRIRKMEERISAKRRIGGVREEDGGMQDLKNLSETLVWMD